VGAVHTVNTPNPLFSHSYHGGHVEVDHCRRLLQVNAFRHGIGTQQNHSCLLRPQLARPVSPFPFRFAVACRNNDLTILLLTEAIVDIRQGDQAFVKGNDDVVFFSIGQ
jgi:hypothetical protein